MELKYQSLADAITGTPVDELVGQDGVLTDLGELCLTNAIDLMCTASWRQADSLGWHDRPREEMEELMLITTEVAEGAEEVRKGNPGVRGLYYDIDTGKPEGLASELADVMIRIGDMAMMSGRRLDVARGVIDKLRYNRKRGYRHGGKVA